MEKKLLNKGLPNLLLRLWLHLSSRRHYQFGLLMGLMLVSSFAEVISLGSVLPFLGILVAPDQVLNHPIAADLVQAWGVTSADQLVLPLTVAFAALALVAGAVRMLLLWVTTRLAFACGEDLSIEVYRRTLYQPYHVHLALNSSSVLSGIQKVNGTVAMLLQLLIMTNAILLLFAIMLALLAIDPMVASLAAVSFGASYALITWMCRRRLHRNSQRIAHEQTQVVKALQEGLGGIRDVLLDGTQSVYCDIYRQANHPLMRARASNAFIGQSPRYAMETLGILLITALAYKLSLQVGGVATAIPVLGTLALAAQRLLPALQQIYNGWAVIAGNRVSLVDSLKLLDQALPVETLPTVTAPLLFQKEVQLRGAHFRYTSDTPWVLDGLSLAIPRGARVGFVGSTGSGKTTTVDLLMGLLMLTEGEVIVDGQPIRPNSVRAWQRNIAHVPQNIYLADTTLAENIAFGVPSGAIDLDRVKNAARQAQIADFIENRPEEYQAHVGERGVRLSGGQRQRIGIARALYKQASVLVFDEATSALDNATEKSVMDAIEGLDRDLTILFVAHRLSTLQRCDFIVELGHGRVIAQGTYEHLLECSSSFRRMSNAI